MTFKELNLDERLLTAIDYMGFENASPVQELVIPIILENRDLIACAQTGTGKTAAFVLPILHKIAQKENSGCNTLIIAPTRELALQIEKEIQGFSYFTNATSIAIYGGGDGVGWESQKKALTQGTDIIIATPGKLISHLNMGYVDFSHIEHFILDEADKMLDMGFVDDIRKIAEFLPKQRQNLMFSATMPESIRKLTREILKDPKEINLALSKPAENIDQKACILFENQKIPLIQHVLKGRPDYDSILVFTSTKSKVGEIVRSLKKVGLEAMGISSNLEQDEREKVLQGFRARQIRILVATDVMSRGIDIKEINMVINFDIPHDAEDYVHRIGRTARVNSLGEALTLVTADEFYKFSRIERLIEQKVPRLTLPQELGAPPELKSRPKKNGRKKPFEKKEGGKRAFNNRGQNSTPKR